MPPCHTGEEAYGKKDDVLLVVQKEGTDRFHFAKLIPLLRNGQGTGPVSAIRWREVALACGAALAPRQALRFNLIASFFNQGLPSTVGGDAARIWLLARTGAGWWKATCSVLLDRFIGVLALTTLVR